MWFKKDKKENKNENTNVVNKNDEMSKMIDEVLNEQAQAKEDAMKETIQPDEPSLNIAGLIEKFHANQNEAMFKTVLDALLPSTLLVTMTPVKNSENKDDKTMQFSPVMVKDANGDRLLPAFSDNTQVSDKEKEQFSLVSMPFKAACELVNKVPDCDRIIVNPFTKPFVISKELVENIAKASEEQRAKNNQMVEFSTPEPETEATVKMVVELFKNESEIRNAYFTKMKNQGRVSYAFIIEHDGDHTVIFPRLIEAIKEKKIVLPITLLPSKGLEKVINESKQLKKVY